MRQISAFGELVWPRNQYRTNETLVEAAGVEPASEKAGHQENYMLVPFAMFRGRQSRTDKNPSAASPIVVTARPRTESAWPSR